MILFILNDLSEKKPIKWIPTFEKGDKSPFGLKVLFSELTTLFPNSHISLATSTPYEYLSVNYFNEPPLPTDTLENPNQSQIYTDSVENIENMDYVESESETDTLLIEKEFHLLNYIFIDDYIDIDKISVEYLLDFVDEGGQVMLSGYGLPELLLDTLQVEIDHQLISKIKIGDSTQLGKIQYKEPKIVLSFANKKLDAKNYIFEKGIEAYSFKKVDTLHTTVLGYQNFENQKKINFVKVNFGDGVFYLHTQPFVFTNYNLLKTGNQEYIANVLSYLPDLDIIFDDRNTLLNTQIQNPLRYMLSQPALRWAWVTSLIGLVLFVIFRAKRLQRMVPIIEKLPNTSIDFAKTIGNLYYQEGKPQDIVHKKITFFLEYIRNTYLMDTQNLNDDFKKRLQAKTGISRIETDRLIDYIIELNNQENIPENSLILLNNMIEDFYLKSKKNLK